MRNSGKFRGGLAFLFFIGVFALAALAVMFLWNWLIPSIIGWSVINYWQAIGLMALTRLLLGGFGKFGPFDPRSGGFFPGNREGQAQIREQMKNMSWEERREHIRKHMADFRNGRFDMQDPTPGNQPQ
ncbi:hypothetical protein [Parabacteroides timonensis]|uniref:hypothetical protein n=1 Tax=Parabacteroides timonensis TaxID=1871013 RepID=UPI00094EF07E|nr:hypothetical protein [Parabacteroides timonensis]